MGETRERKVPDRTCRYHCTSCGEHFTSLEAFDHHRAGSFGRNRRYCKSPDSARSEKGRVVLQAQTRAGVCRLGDPDHALLSVTLWEAA